MVAAPSAEIRYVARVSDAESARLRELHGSAPRVHKSLPENHPRRRQSRELSELLSRLHRRGVPIDVMADIIGISHQAIRARVAATELDYVTFDPSGVATLSIAERNHDAIFVADSGMHRRLLVYPNPAAIAHLRMLADVPYLTRRDQVSTWLESYSTVKVSDAPSATPLRTPPAVYITSRLVNELLVELTPTPARGNA
jgi:hypothetical protein